MEKISMKEAIYTCISNILTKNNKEYAKLSEIYEEVSFFLETENNKALQSQIRGRLQECCEQYTSFTGEALFLTEKIRSGNWTIKSKVNTVDKNRKKYIRYINNNYLITNDNWANVEESKTITDEYILEQNLDMVYKVKLINLLGKERANIIIKELNEIRKLLKQIKKIDKVKDGYGLAFEVFAISTIYNVCYEECINKYIVHGDYDGKIDAIYYADKNNIYIYQIKISNIDDNAYNEMKKNYDCCIKDEVPENGKDLYNFIKTKSFYLENKKQIFKSISTNSKKQSNIQPLEIYELFFKNKLLPINNNNLILTIKKPSPPNKDEYEYNVSTDGKNNFSFYIKASDLANYLLKSLGIDKENYDIENIDISKYFSDNVRGVLSVNKKMLYTIKNEPENFVKYNNGINITGEVEDLGLNIIIKNPVINNGQQTITTLIRTNENLEKITIPVKITNETDMVIKGKISQYSNEQVKVKAIDMLSLNSYIRDLQYVIFNNKYKGENYFLEIYSSGKKNYYDIIKKIYKKHNIISLLDFVKLYFSVENKRDLGLWKNTPNSQIENTIINDYFNETLAFKVCDSIRKYEEFMCNIQNKKEKDDFKSSDLAFKYLLCKENLLIEEVVLIIKSINQKYYYSKQDEKSKLIDIYKSSSIIEKIEEELKLFKDNKILINN